MPLYKKVFQHKRSSDEIAAYPSWSPDGTQLALAVHYQENGVKKAGVFVISTTSGEVISQIKSGVR